MALGREGPTVQMGAAMGQLVGEKSGSGDMERRNLVSAGAAAGLTAAFNAPLAGILFVIEELHGKITPNTFFGAFIACVTADTVMRLSLGQEPYFGLMNFDLMPLGLLPAFVLLGLFAGWGGVLFNKSMIIALDFFAAPRKGLPVWWPGAAVGAGVGLVAWFLPDAVGDGHKLWQMMFEMRFAFGAIAGLFLLRFVMSVLCYSTGAPGGIFAPILVLGGFLGLALGMAAQIVFPDMGVNPVLFTVAGMGAFLTGSVRAPLTSMVLIVEMSGDYNLMLPLLVACLSAYGAAELTGDKAIYEALLERDIARGQAAAVPSPAKGQS
ncbi:chloride channel protein [Kamptonema cortianum]|nr:chloride channel protein [Kamptonema cortianum]